MDIVVAAVGSYGDVYPLIAIGSALKQRGYSVTLISAAPFARLAQAAGLAFMSCLSDAEYAQYVEVGKLKTAAQELNFLTRLAMAPMRTVYDMLHKNFDPKSTIVIALPLVLGARIAQEKHQFPLISVVLQPSTFCSVIKPIKIQSVPKFLQKFSFIQKMFLFYFLRFFDHLLQPVHLFRKALGLPQQKYLVKEWVFSPQKIIALFPSWLTEIPPDWPKQIVFTGFIRPTVKAVQHLSVSVRQFLDAGEPPIVFTCGTSVKGGEDFFSAAVAVITALKQRAVLVTMYPEQLPKLQSETILCVDYVAFDLLFPKAKLIVHHGGIGTTAESLASGVPQLLLPKMLDQFHNAALVEALGCGLSVDIKECDTEKLKEKIAYLLQAKPIQARCRAVAAKIDFDQALVETSDLIEKYLADLIG